MSSDTLSKSTKSKWIPQPQRATILSAVLPGLGQIYNRKYWKLPILYAAGGALYYFYDINNKEYLKNKRLFEEESAKGSSGDKYLKDNYYNKLLDFRKKRDYKIILMGVLYIANVVDAMADAYFASYDISDDLGFIIKPKIFTDPYLSTNSFAYGFTLSLHF
jgi:hypothetical protein